MIQSAVPPIAKSAFLSGVHQKGDQYRMALYDKAADLGARTKSYTRDGEARGEGYAAGGKLIDDWKVVETPAGAHVEFGAVIWPGATLKAAGAMVYNASRPGNPAIAVLSFGEEVASTRAPFTVRLEDKLLTL